MKYVVGVDIGGTFTDLVSVDEAGATTIVKTPSTPHDPSVAVSDALQRAAQELGTDYHSYLSSITRICHGTTVSTNTVLTWSGARVGFLTTQGFRDILGIRFGIRETPYDYTIPSPKALSPRNLRVPVEERIKWNGEVVTRLNENDVRKACKYFREQKIDAVVVGFLWSFKNRSHERRAAEICREELPGVYVCASCDIQPEIREYWRFSTAVLSAYVGPNLSNYIQNLVQTLKSDGFEGELLITQSNAGIISPEIAVEQAVRTILSGPACGPAAAAYLAAPVNIRDLITVDMGGTSFDVCLIKDGKPATTLETAVGGVYHMRLPMMDVHTIGAGGGSIAWLDSMNVLHVGPKSAGSVPGPACYGRGGAEPTSTDADLVLGYLNPQYFNGGEMSLDASLAEKAIKERIAAPLGITVVAAARAIRKIIDHNMSDAISTVSVERGEDPRGFTLVAAGGAGPVHVTDLAKALGIPRVLISRNSSIFCAMGSIIADLRHDFVTSVVTKTNSADLDALNASYEAMKDLGDQYLSREGIAEADRYYEKSVDMRYKGQFHEVELPLPGGTVGPAMRDFMVSEFHKKHEELYGYRDEVETEVINLRRACFGRVVAPERKALSVSSYEAGKFVKSRRDVYFEDEFGFVPTQVFDGDLLQAGNIVEGPAIVEQRTTTVVVPPKARLEVTNYGDYLVIL